MTANKTAQELMTDNLIVKHLAGSKAYGTSLPTSDTDYRGVFVADPINVRTPFFPIREVADTSEEDTKIYELSQFMKLAIDCNPNIIETLWVRMDEVVFHTPAYLLLREAAPKLLSKKIAFTTCGYALSQLKRIRGHNKWINNPMPVQAPRQVDYLSLVHNFTPDCVFKFNLADHEMDHRLVPYGTSEVGAIYGVYPATDHSLHVNGVLSTDYEGDTHSLGTPLFVVKYNKQQYLSDRDRWQQYWDWKRNRNAARSELEEQFGYDTKHAMHLVRLLHMGKEALEDGVINVFREDADLLLAIRRGEWTYEEVVKYAESLDSRIRGELYEKSQLPHSPDIHFAAQLTLAVQEAVWNK